MNSNRYTVGTHLNCLTGNSNEYPQYIIIFICEEIFSVSSDKKSELPGSNGSSEKIGNKVNGIFTCG